MPIRCSNCDEQIVAPTISRFISPNDILHVWYCSDCFAVFERRDCLMPVPSDGREMHCDCEAGRSFQNGNAQFSWRENASVSFRHARNNDTNSLTLQSSRGFDLELVSVLIASLR